ncbi:MAG: DNA polymerase III subunit alpha [Acidobacteriota bacterium]|nr:DNA polymerase III subunit alpha [Acidobacteriota bacterium]
MKRYIHLHVHSEYSLLDSSLKIDDMLRKARDFQMPAVALTDHGSILGAVNFYKKALQSEVKPIIGAELYLAPGSRFDRPNRREDELNYFHLLALVRNDQGYRNLCELITASYLEGFYRKPRIDKELLEKYRDGLLVMSACIQGELPYHLLRGQPEKARAAARWYRETFKDNFFIEVQDHGLAEQKQALPLLIDLAREMDIPLAASNDVHYLTREDADAREILICLQTTDVISNPDRPMKKETDQMYFKSGEEMAKLPFAAVAPQALANTFEIASRCNFEFKLKKYFLPAFKTPGKLSVDDYFEKLCLEGFERIQHQYLTKAKHLKHGPAEYEKRLKYEIEKIREMGFPGYFLIVWDIIRFAKESGIPVGPGRGSVVGSLVAFVMGITQIDPLEYDLIFERFLNPERISLPDIDIDFDAERREEIITYIREKYGEDNVAQVVTFNRMKAKLAIRDIGRVMEVKLADVNRLAKLVPEGPKVELQDAIDRTPDLQREIKHSQEFVKLINYALRLENNIRNTGKHAAGVVIAPRKLTEFMPLYKTREDITTHFEKEEVENIGLLKMDILGLKTLTIIKNILSEVREREGKAIDLENLNLLDARTFKIFQKGDTDGIFQFESSGMRDYLKKSKPTRIEDLIVLNALYRPGPLQSGMADVYVNRKLGREKVSFIFPELEEILKDTYGIIVFQEQVMQISVRIANFSMSEADEMRKIMGKKDVSKMPAQEKKFLERAAKKGYDKKKLEELFGQMKTFAEYGFNKSHATAYAYLAYQTAFLKAHYPVYFMAAHLSSEADKTTTSSKIIQYISESKKMGIDILPPDINKSREAFRVETDGAVRFGLIGLKNVGSAALAIILKAREEGGEFKNFNDFVERIDLAKVNKGVLESLIKAGACDGFGLKRRVLFESIGEVLRRAAAIGRSRSRNQKALFTDAIADDYIPREMLALEEWPESEMIKGEKESAGIYVSHNPLEKFSSEIRKVSNTTVMAIQTHDFKGEVIKLGGVVTEFARRTSKKGDAYGEIFFEDLTGRIKVLCFKDRWRELEKELKADVPYFLEGRSRSGGSDNESEETVYLENLQELEAMLKKKARKIVITIGYDLIDEAFNEKLMQKLEKNRDSVPYMIVIIHPDDARVVINSEPGQGIRATAAMKKDIEKLTGPNSIEILF